MRDKYIHIEDISKEIEKECEFLETFEKEIEHSKKRIKYLSCLENYLFEDGLCPFTKKELLENDIKLQDYVMPLLVKEEIILRQKIVRFKEFKRISKDNIGELLKDFINFCVELKNGKKFGVGEFHIQSYLDNREFV